MENNSVQYWEFELVMSEPTSVVTSSSFIVNIVCASFATIPDNQVVSKIKAGTSLFVGMITKGEEAKTVLIEDYFTGKILLDLKPIENYIPSCRFHKIQLIQTGVVLCDGDSDFANLKYEASMILSELTNIQGRKEIIFIQSLMANDGERILSQQLTPSQAEDLLKNLSSLPLTSSQAPTFSSNQFSYDIPSTSSNTLNDLEILQSTTSSAATIDFDRENKANSIAKPALILRDYQEELSKPGLEGQNCIVVAPTGSGKTFVAVNICKEHIKKTTNAKVLFLVPTKPLVRQQSDVFSKFLEDPIYQVSGETTTTVPASVSIRSHTISVMTPKILFDLLKSQRSQDRMSLEEISLLIFDECHNTTKNTVYNEIMRLYMDEKLSSEPSPKKLPQIVGLTASPGVGKAKTEAKAEENIQTLMANLDVTIAPAQVIECRSSLKLQQTEAEEVTIVVRRNPDDIFATKTKEAMKEIEVLMLRYRDMFDNVIDDLECKCRASYSSQEYEAFAVDLLNKSKLIGDKEASLWFMGFATHLRKYNIALTMNDLVRSSDVRDYLEEAFDYKLNLNHVDQVLFDIFEKHNPGPVYRKNPMLEELRRVVVDQYNRKPESRTIIFVRTRTIVNALVQYLQDETEIIRLKLNPLPLTGANAKKESFGMNQPEQENNLKVFREGACKILVATSVAEEGLDIEECNLVVGYSYSTNEIGLVQRKGRGRAKDSKYIVVALEDSDHVRRERANQARVKLTDDILKRIQAKDPLVLKAEIVQMQKKEKKERDLQKQVERTSAQEIEDKTPYEMLCVGCKTLVTTSKFFQHINNQHHVVVDPDFKHRAVIRRNGAFIQIKPDEYLTGKIFCKKPECEQPWGTRMLYKKATIYVLKITNFIITNSDGFRELGKKWSRVPFKHAIKPLDLDDYLNAMRAQDIISEEDLAIDDALLFGLLN